jgi:hypothetical protein
VVAAGAVGAAVVGATVGVAVGTAVVGGVLGVGLGAAVVGATVRTWVVTEGEGDTDGVALGEGDGEAEAPARRERPPPSISAITTSMSRPPATAARIRSIHRGPRRGGGMIFVVSDMTSELSAPSVPTSARRSLVG